VNRREFVTLAAGMPFALRASFSPPQLEALVTCDAESRLAVVDLRTFQVVSSIGTLPDPRSIERVGDAAVVCHTAVGAVSIVARGRVRAVVRGFVEPRYVAAHPDGRHAFVTDSGRSGVVALDVRRAVTVARAPLPGWARHITVDPAGTRVWLGLGSASEHVAVVDTKAMRRVSLLTPGFGAHDVGHAPDGRLWITSGASRELAIAGANQAADAAPQHVTFARRRAFVTSGDAGTLQVLDLHGRVLRTTPIPIGSYNVQYGGGRVITPSLDRGTLAILDSHGALLARLDVAASCHDACLYGSLTA
jgi:DNA-binding beta-propeller fold protein YncE